MNNVKSRNYERKVNIRCFACVGRREGNKSKYQRRLYFIAVRGRRLHTAYGSLQIAANGAIHPIWLRQMTWECGSHENAFDAATRAIQRRRERGYDPVTKIGPKPKIRLSPQGIYRFLCIDGTWRAAVG